VKPASLAEGAALARIERVIEPAQAEQTTVAQDRPRTELTRLDQARIKRWIANQSIDWPPTSCLHCRRPIVPGQLWTVVSNGEITARFHQDCHGAWRAQQEVFARRALGFAA
jgi:RNase P subunit RPR2